MEWVGFAVVCYLLWKLVCGMDEAEHARYTARTNKGWNGSSRQPEPHEAVGESGWGE